MTGSDRITRRRLLKAGFGGALVATLFFAYRLGETAFHWDRARNAQGLEPWMTPRYVAHSRRVPAAVVSTALGLDPSQPPRRLTLREIAASRGVPVEALLEDLDAAIKAHREALR